MRVSARLALLALFGLWAAACDDRSDPRYADSPFLGNDLPTVAALGPGGHPLVGVNSLGVSYSEFQDPATGDVFAGVTGTSTAGRLASLDDDNELRWQVGFPAGVSDPVVTPEGLILVTSGHFLIALTGEGEVAWRVPSAGPIALAPSGLIYQGATTALRAIASDGSSQADLVRQVELPGQFFLGAPSIGPDSTVFFLTTADPGGFPKPTLHAAGPGGGLLWSTELPGAATGEAADGALLVGPDGTVWVNGTADHRTLLRGFDTHGKQVHSLPDHTVAAIGADGTLYGLVDVLLDFRRPPEHPTTLQAFDADGATKWSAPSVSSSLTLLDDGGVMLFEVVTDDIGDRYFGHRLNAKGEQKKQVEVVINHFTGSPLVRDDGFIFQPGFWANQNPPFEVRVTSFELSGVEPASRAWTRSTGDARNTRAPWPTKSRKPGAAQLVGRWSRVDDGIVHVFRFGRSDIAYPDLARVETPFELWRTPVGATRPTLVARGGVALSEGRVVLTPTWGAGEGKTLRLALGESDPWSLSLADPTAPDKPVEWRMALGIPLPDSPLQTAGRPRWAHADSGAASTFALDPASGRVFVAGQYLSDADSRLGGNTLEEPPCCGGYGTFHALLAADAKSYEFTYSTVDTVAGGSADVPVGATFDSTGRPRLLSHPSVPRPTEAGVALLCATEIWSVDGESHDVAALNLKNEQPGDLQGIAVTAYALDAADGEAIVGLLHGTARFTGGLELQGEAPASLFLMHYTAEGRLDVAEAVRTQHMVRPVQAIYAPDGNLILDGESDEGVGLLALDPQGDIVFERSFPAHSIDEITLAVSKSGALALGGAFDGTLDLGAEVMVVNDPPANWLTGDAFVARFDREGELTWARQLGGVERQAVGAIAFDASENVVVAGMLGAPLAVEGVVASPWLRAYDRCGAELFTRDSLLCDGCGAPTQFVGNFQPLSLAVAADGDLVVMGWPNAWTELDGVLVGPPHPDKGSGTGGAFAVLRLSGIPKDAVSNGACPESWHDVTVTVPGKAGGRVVSEPPGIDCPGVCTVAFEGLAPVVLTAVPPENGRFDGWSGACHGDGPCTLVTGTQKAVTARFGRPALDAVEVVHGLPERVYGAAPAGDDVILALWPLSGANRDFGGLTIPPTPSVAVTRVHGTTVRWAHLLETTDPEGLTLAGAAADPRGGIVVAAAVRAAVDLTVDGVALTGASGAGPLVLAALDAEGGLRFARVHDGLSAGPIHVASDGTIASCRNGVFGPDGEPLWVLQAQGSFNAEHCLAMPGGDSIFVDTAALTAYDRAGEVRWNLPLEVAKITGLAPTPDGGFLLSGQALEHPLVVDGVSLESFFLLWLTADGHLANAVALNDLGIHGVSAVSVLADGSALAAVAPTDAPVTWPAEWLVAPTDELVLVNVAPDATVRWATSARMGSEAGAGVLLAPGPFLVPAADGRVLLAGGLGGTLDFGRDPNAPAAPFENAPFYVTLRP